MTFSALDSALLGTLFATDTMRAVFSDEARLAAMLRAETALARAEAAAGLVPDALAEELLTELSDGDAESIDVALASEFAAGAPVDEFVAFG